MARTPFNTPSPSPNQPPPGGTGLPPRPAGPPGAGPQAPHPQTPGMGGPPGGSAQGGSGPGGSAHGPAPRPQPQERRTLVVGRGISLNGTIKDAERLEVEGTVEAQLLNASELAVTQGGTFKGEVEVDACEIAGTMDGSVTARVSLVVRSTGRIIGTARCRRLQVEDGGQISGQIEMIAEGAAPPRAQD